MVYNPLYILPIVVVLTLLKRLGVPVDSLPAYFQKRRRRRQQISNVTKIVNDGVCNILAVYPPEDTKTGKWESIVRYDYFKELICKLKAVLEDPSIDIPHEIRSDISCLCSDIDRTIELHMKGRFGGISKGDYEENVVKPLLKWKWLRLKVKL